MIDDERPSVGDGRTISVKEDSKLSEEQKAEPSDFASVADFNSLYSSYTEARKGKRWKYAVCKYEANILENLMFIHFMLTSHKYRLSPYNCLCRSFTGNTGRTGGS